MGGRAGRRRGEALTPWLLPAVFAVHVAEEAPGFTEWVNEHASPRYTNADFARNNALGLLMTGGATALVARSRDRRLFFAYYSAVLSQQALFNPVFHAGTTAAFQRYSPGLATSLAFIPVWWRLTRLALREGRLTRTGAVAGAAIGGAIHAAAVAKQVFRVRKP
jgi:Protein of unknown function with HXXEE motif